MAFVSSWNQGMGREEFLSESWGSETSPVNHAVCCPAIEFKAHCLYGSEPHSCTARISIKPKPSPLAETGPQGCRPQRLSPVRAVTGGLLLKGRPEQYQAEVWATPPLPPVTSPCLLTSPRLLTSPQTAWLHLLVESLSARSSLDLSPRLLLHAGLLLL